VRSRRPWARTTIIEWAGVHSIGLFVSFLFEPASFDALASLDWTLDEAQALHGRIQAAMRAEVELVSGMLPAKTEAGAAVPAPRR